MTSTTGKKCQPRIDEGGDDEDQQGGETSRRWDTGHRLLAQLEVFSPAWVRENAEANRSATARTSQTASRASATLSVVASQRCRK